MWWRKLGAQVSIAKPTARSHNNQNQSNEEQLIHGACKTEYSPHSTIKKVSPILDKITRSLEPKPLITGVSVLR